MYMMEIGRGLRRGGYWVLSGPLINWKTNYKAWERTEADLAAEQQRIEEYAAMLCWEKITEIREIGIWRKQLDPAAACLARLPVHTCDDANRDDVWYKNMETCITPPTTASAGQLQPFPARLTAVPRGYRGVAESSNTSAVLEASASFSRSLDTAAAVAGSR